MRTVELADVGREDEMFRRKKEGGVKVAENPAQPPGWAVKEDSADSENAEKFREDMAKAREETAKQIDENNREPEKGENPAQPKGWAVSKNVLARVFTAGSEPQEGDRVLLRLRDKQAGKDSRSLGTIIALSEDVPDGFAAEWDDGDVTLERKQDYEVVQKDQEKKTDG